MSLPAGCVTGGSMREASTRPPTFAPGSARVLEPEVGLPFHRAAIVDVALLAPGSGQRWRLASGDEDGWIRIWADGKLLFAALVHPGGVSAVLATPEGELVTAGFDGRVLEWSGRPKSGVPAPARGWQLVRPGQDEGPEQSGGPQGSAAAPAPVPVTALALTTTRLAVSDGYHVQLWSRGEAPELLWSRPAKHFVTGLSLSPSGEVIAAAELSPIALRKGRADHPLAVLDAEGYPSEDLELRRFAARDFPGARADFVESWEPSHRHHRHFFPGVPIDPDLSVLDEGVVAYREIWSGAESWVTAIRLRDRERVWMPLVKPWPFMDQDNAPTGVPRGTPVGDLVLGPAGELVVVDHHGDWALAPPSTGWIAGDHRELTVGQGYTAMGDGQGGLVLAKLTGTSPSWTCAGEERPELVASAPGRAKLVTATLGPRTRYRALDLDLGLHHLLRVEPPSQVLPARADGQATPAVFPTDLAMDDAGHVATSGWTFADGGLAYGAVRLLAPELEGGLKTLHHGPTSEGFALAMSPNGTEIRAWTTGELPLAWLGGEAAKLETRDGAAPISGIPLYSRDGAWSATVGRTRRELIDRRGARGRLFEGDPAKINEDLVAALSDAGTLALVQPFGGGELELLYPASAGDGDGDGDGVPTKARRVELPGAATALAWTGATLLIGFQDGSIAKLERAQAHEGEGLDDHANEGESGFLVQVIHAGSGGRVWSLEPVQPRAVEPTPAPSPEAVPAPEAQTTPAPAPDAGVFVELDERGLTLHRLVDGAFIELHFGDPTAASRHASSPAQTPRATDWVALWRDYTGAPPCLVLDGSAAGVRLSPALASDPPPLWGAERSADFFGAFMAGRGCSDAAAAPHSPSQDPQNEEQQGEEPKGLGEVRDGPGVEPAPDIPAPKVSGPPQD